MWLIDQLAEQRIREAAGQGAFDDLTGAGQPLSLDDDVAVPAELRAAYRLLKNAGYLPPELQLRRDIVEAEQLLALAEQAEERASHSRRLRYLMMAPRPDAPGARELADRARLFRAAVRETGRVLTRLDRHS